MSTTKLSVNVNKIATLRNARGGNNPDLEQVTKDIIKFGAQGITVHPRPDERHIKLQDVYQLNKVASEQGLEFNIEGYPSENFLNLIAEVRPAQCTLVPDPPDVITSNAGWNCEKQKEFLIQVVGKLKTLNVRSSIFIDPYSLHYDSLAEIQPDRCELYTEMYAAAYEQENFKTVLQQYKQAAEKIMTLNIGLNAGHDLDLNNIKTLITEIPTIKEVSIGHALVCESLYQGLETVIGNYLKEMQ